MQTISPTRDELVAFAENLADAARPIAQRYFRSPLTVEDKQDHSPVTVADREIERRLRELIKVRYPGHGIFGEEEGGADLDNAHLWVVDPIDGTKSFISGMPTFGTLVAFVSAEAPRVGVIDMPALDERWTGADGVPTLRNGQPCQTRSCVRLADAIIYATSPDIFSAEEAARFETVSRRARMRRFGGDCYAYALLASGCIDAVMEAQMKPYDYLALVPVIEGAGGFISDWRGEPLGLGGDGRVVAAATRQLHDEMLELIAA
jgi:inositol-phosphate phosphatase/L-galactose 1-phosphate phosphatase/histidinol-phosphatase